MRTAQKSSFDERSQLKKGKAEQLGRKETDTHTHTQSPKIVFEPLDPAMQFHKPRDFLLKVKRA